MLALALVGPDPGARGDPEPGAGAGRDECREREHGALLSGGARPGRGGHSRRWARRVDLLEDVLKAFGLLEGLLQGLQKHN